MSLQTMRSLLEVREEMRRAREKPRETLAELMRIGNRELRPGQRQADEDAALVGDTPFFEPGVIDEAAAESASTSPASAKPAGPQPADAAAFEELDTEHLIRMLTSEHEDDDEANAKAAEAHDGSYRH